MATFNLHTQSTGNTYYFVQDANNAIWSRKTTASIPAANRGPGGTTNKMVITKISIDVGGYSNSGTVNFCVWSTDGVTTYYASPNITGLDAIFADTNPPAVSHTVPTADRFALTGAAGYLFGVHNENTGGVTVQRNPSSGVDMVADESHAAPGDNLTFQTYRYDYSLVGTVTYIYLPSAPVLGSTGVVGGRKQLTVTWSAPTDDGDSQATYIVYWRKQGTSTWYSFKTNSTSLTYTITGLENNTTYEVRVAAENGASDVLEVTSEYSTTRTATTLPGGPQVRSGLVWKASEIFVYDGSVWKEAEMLVRTSNTWKGVD